jgi:DamX protein
MNEFAEPAYVSRLSLQSAPFNSTVEPKNFFSGSQSEHRLNLLLHLIRASNKIGVLIAADGLGKTTLLTQLRQQRAGDELRICSIEGQAQIDNASALKQCLTALGVDENEIRTSDDYAETFRNRLEHLRKLQVRPVLLIDDANILSEELITGVSIWLGWQSDNEFLLQAVIATTSGIKLAGPAQSRVQTVDLPPMTEQELPDYLMYRLTSVGYAGDTLFSEKDLKHFYRLSSGNPALINQLAHQKLLGLKPSLAKSATFNLGQLHSSLRWVGLGMLVISLILLLSYQEEVNQWLTPTSEDIELVEQDVIEIREPELVTVIVDKDEVKDTEQAQREELAALLSDIPEPEVLEQSMEQFKQADTKSLDPKSEIVESIKEVHQQDWVMQQDGSHYTFQLMGSWEKQEVHDFIDKYALTDNVAMFESMRNGRIWYALTYGVFENKQSALDASNKWPAPLNTLPSWLRRFDSVQKQIKNTVQVQ